MAKVFDLTSGEAVIPTCPSVDEARRARFHRHSAPMPTDQSPLPIETLIERRTRIGARPAVSRALAGVG